MNTITSLQHFWMWEERNLGSKATHSNRTTFHQTRRKCLRLPLGQQSSKGTCNQNPAPNMILHFITIASTFAETNFCVSMSNRGGFDPFRDLGKADLTKIRMPSLADSIRSSPFHRQNSGAQPEVHSRHVDRRICPSTNRPLEMPEGRLLII